MLNGRLRIGNGSARGCCVIQRAVGCLFTLQHRTCLRSWAIKKKSYRRAKVRLGTVRSPLLRLRLGDLQEGMPMLAEVKYAAPEAFSEIESRRKLFAMNWLELPD